MTVIAGLTACSSAETVADGVRAEAPSIAMKLIYPKTERGDQVDDYHGVRVEDPYRWLENVDSSETLAWIGDQNRLTESWLATIPARARLSKRLTELFSYERRGVIGKVGGTLFYSRNPGLAAQAVIWKQGAEETEPAVVLDPNTLSSDGTVSISGFEPSDDGRWLAYSTSDGGSDWRTWHVRDLTTMQDTADVLLWSKFAGAAWAHDSSGFFYCRYPVPEAGNEREQANYFHKVYFHRLGETQEQDTLVYERPDQKEWGFSPIVTDDGRFLVMNVSQGTDRRNRVYVKDLAAPDAAAESSVVKLLDDFDASYDYVGAAGTTFYFKTDLDAPRSRVIAIDFDHPARDQWREVVPTAADSLGSVSLVNGTLFLNYLHDGSTRIRMHRLADATTSDFALPGIGTAGGFSGKSTDTETFWTFASFTSPTTVYRLDTTSGESTVWFAPQLAADLSPYETRFVQATSKDGTKVPMHVTCRKDLVLDGTHPCLLYGYGGFNISLTPSFSTQRVAWLELGGIFVQSMLRGGAEYGEEWHAAGMFGKKQNVFDDFIACAEHLIAGKYTSSRKLAIFGGSNGGLLVGACMTQRPELFAAAIPAVGVLDMLRYQLFTIGRAWTSEYGCAENPEQFPFLRAYSPLHNLKVGAHYPATLVLTGDHDDRVVPGHSFKFAAALQTAQSGAAPTLIRVETRAGHGAGKSTQMQIDEQADLYAFLVKALQIRA
ncbi:MAG: S9 family peptidase [Planctomycetes bacterium]|nr:S9 family peptidase [Planctomycetota bacterium]